MSEGVLRSSNSGCVRRNSSADSGSANVIFPSADKALNAVTYEDTCVASKSFCCMYSTMICAFSSVRRLQSVLHQLSGSTIDGASYTVDNAGNRTAKTDQRANVTSNYTYDPIYELTQATQGGNTTESYTYDPVGNRLSSLGVSSYNNNVSNELTSTPSTTYTYDNNGNTQTKVVGTSTTSYAWDYENRMTSVTLPGSGGTVTFAYDPFGRRIKKVTSTTTSIFAYDGDNLIEETNSSGAAVARYEPTQNIDEPLAMLRSGGTSYFHADGLGSVTSLSNAAGSLAQTYAYDSFGKQTASSGSLVNPFQYTARESDSETGLYYYRARYYDLGTGRFLSEDGIHFTGGDTNFYRFVYNAPANYADPTGLIAIDPNFRADCLKNLQRALDILRRLPKTNPQCDCYFRSIGDRKTLQQLLDEPGRTIHSDNVDARNNGAQEKAYTLPGDKLNIYIRPYTCRMGRWSLASAIVHELTHITLTPRADDPVQEGAAQQMAL